jgi:hypothetical protein
MLKLIKISFYTYFYCTMVSVEEGGALDEALIEHHLLSLSVCNLLDISY